MEVPMMRGVFRTALAAACLLCLGAAPAAASAATGAAAHRAADSPAAQPGGFVGPVVTHPPAAPFTYQAGEVCSFAVHVTFPINKVIQRTWTNDAGQPVFAIAGGLLIARVTNVATGRSAVADLNQTGTYSYPGDGSFILSGSGGVLAGFHSGDTPHNKLIVSLVSAHSFISVRVAVVNGQLTRTLLQLSGPHEDLCQVLASPQG
jgi:hypothetical protein